MKKLLIYIISLLILLSSVSVVGFAEDEEPPVKTLNGFYDIEAPDYESEIALLVNADTDTVVYSKNADKVTSPASLTKIVTALVVLSKNDPFNTQITCSGEALDSLLGTGSSTMGLVSGEVVTLESLLYCMLLPDANDAAVVLADHYGNGSVQAFVDEMNTYCKNLGCTNTFFANPYGADDRSIEGYNGKTQNQTTAYDMYLISKEAWKNDTLMEISNIYEYVMPPTSTCSENRCWYNTNGLINNYNPHFCDGAKGLKIGSTDKAGTCAVSTSKKDGYTYISIAMGGTYDYFESGQTRNTALTTCRYMLNWAFSNIELKILADDSYNIGEIAVKFGRGNDYVALVPATDVTAVVHKNISIDNMTIELSESFPEKIKAPVKKGDEVGQANLIYQGIKVAEITLVAQQDVKKNHLWAMFSWIEKLMSSKVFITVLVLVIVGVVVYLFATKNSRDRKKRRKNKITIVKDYSKLAK